jgi:hypothetical protein
MTEGYDIVLLDPKTAKFNRTPGGVLSLHTGSADYAEVLLFRAFPLSMQDRFISVRTPKGDEIGMIADVSELEEASRMEVLQELQLRYMIPRVTRIDKIKQLPGMWVWNLQTTLGPIKLSMRNLHEHVQSVGRGRLLLSDLDGNRCEIADIDALDAGSRKQLNRIM